MLISVVNLQNQRAAAEQTATTKKEAGIKYSLSELAGHKTSPQVDRLFLRQPELILLFSCLTAYMTGNPVGAKNPFALVSYIPGYQVGML